MSWWFETRCGRRSAGAALLLVISCRLVHSAEPADPLRPAAIVTADVPAIPAEFAARLSQYQNTRAASFAGWSPDGRGMLVRTRFGNAPQLHLVASPGGRREQLTFWEEPVSGGFIPRATDGAIVLAASDGGSENDQLYFFDRANYRTMRLTDGRSKNRLDAFSPDGRRMIVGSNQRNGRDTDLFLADPRQPGFRETLLEASGEFWSVADWSPDGQQLLLTRYVSANESYPAILDLATRSRRDLPFPGTVKEKVSIGALEFAPGGRQAYVALDAEHEFKRLALVDLATGRYEWLTSDLPWDVSSLEVHDETGLVAFTTNADGASQLFLLTPRPAGLPSRRELSLPTGIVAGLEFSPDGKQLGFTLARPAAPADAFSLELETSRLTQWTFSEVGGLDPSRFVTAERIRFPSFDGREIPGWYFRPRSAAPGAKAPVLIQIHGGPESQAQPFFSGTTQFYVNELGVAVLLPNVRGSAGYGKTYLRLDNAQRREDSVRDIGALLDWVARQPELDATRVAVTGGSYGGYMVLASLMHFGERLRAGIDIVGICNFNTFLANTAAYRADLRRAEYGDERDPKMKAFFERISPANHPQRIVSDLLVIHGRNDPRVPFSEAEQIAARVREQGRVVWTVFADNEGHGFDKKDNADYARAVEAWFLKSSLEIP